MSNNKVFNHLLVLCLDLQNHSCGIVNSLRKMIVDILFTCRYDQKNYPINSFYFRIGMCSEENRELFFEIYLRIKTK